MPTRSCIRIPIPARPGPLFWAVLIGFSLISACQVFSYDCFAPSPSFSGDQTPYDKLNVRDLTQSEQSMLATLFKSLTGRWQGDGDGVQCRGSVDSPSIEHFLYSIQAEGKADYYGNLELKTKIHSITDKTNQTELIRFFLIDNKLRFDNDASAGDVELIELAKNKVKFLQRGRGGPGTLHREVFISLIAAMDTFTIEKKLYTQGHFTFGRVLHFKR
jgi:hypothetical protein